LVKERGLDLRFGAATVVTSVFFMAPLTALFLVLFHSVLMQRGLTQAQASSLSVLFGFGTPVFFRTSTLNHNMFVMYAFFISFVLLWVRPGMTFPLSLRNRLMAGFFGGIMLATDYMGIVTLPLLYGYLLLSRIPTSFWRQSFKESLPFVAGGI